MSARMTEDEAVFLHDAVWRATKGLFDLVELRKAIRHRGDVELAIKLKIIIDDIEALLDAAVELKDWEGDDE